MGPQTRTKLDGGMKKSSLAAIAAGEDFFTKKASSPWKRGFTVHPIHEESKELLQHFGFFAFVPDQLDRQCQVEAFDWLHDDTRHGPVRRGRDGDAHAAGHEGDDGLQILGFKGAVPFSITASFPKYAQWHPFSLGS
jgi:hypothetical protein